MQSECIHMEILKKLERLERAIYKDELNLEMSRKGQKN